MNWGYDGRAYDRSLEPPEEKPQNWEVTVTVTRIYKFVRHGLRDQVEEDCREQIEDPKIPYDSQDVDIESDLEEIDYERKNTLEKDY